MSTMPGTEPLTVTTADGIGLRAELRAPAEPVATAVICHPHPLYGGDMYNNVVTGLFDHLALAGVACLRFNFRGSGGSEGQHGDGRDEQVDVVAAIDELATRWPDKPLILAGYSFGADVSLAIDDARIAGWLAIAPPLRVVEVEQMVAGRDPRPKRLATGTDDDFRAPDQAREATAGWTNHLVVDVPGANHFFMVGMDTVRSTATDLLNELAA
ncbi:MAG: alpha/beta hydrolase [Acidimicrobiales bacterium]